MVPTIASILIVEDDPVWRAMLTRFLDHEQDLKVVESVATKEEAITYCRSYNVDIVLMDINLTHDNLDGIHATLELNQMGYRAKVIILTSLEDTKIIINAFTAGAIYYMSKSDFRKIPDTIRDVLQPASPQEILVNEFMKLKEAEQFNRLTAAEKEIVTLSEEGFVRSQIKDKLGKSESTLKNQITNILKKFNVGTMKAVIHTIKSRGLNDKEL